MTLDKEIRVLQINADNFGAGGMSMIIWRLMSTMNSPKIKVSYLTQKEYIDHNYITSIERKGGQLIKINVSNNKIKRYWDRYFEMCKVLKNYRFDIIHINADEAFGIMSYLLAAKKMKVHKIIVHAHTTQFKGKNKFIRMYNKILHKIAQPVMCSIANDWLACSTESAKFMYGFQRFSDKRIKIIKNALPVDKYLYSYDKRENLRNSLALGEKMIIGHIGRFSYAKNHEFIINVFEILSQKNKNAELWLIGDGEGMTFIKELVKQKKLESQVTFYKNISEISDYLCAMDVLFFPSRFEGMPLVLIEAQVNGLPVVCSSTITDEAIFTDFVYKLDLNISYTEWVNKILEVQQKGHQKVTSTFVQQAGFDIENVAEIIEKIYMQPIC